MEGRVLRYELCLIIRTVREERLQSIRKILTSKLNPVKLRIQYTEPFVMNFNEN
ncbi:unnamed protein product [Brugia timori]|uniref:Lrp/AsnC family transcriptional regulator n=1 Tax=Brugia timori TaxID=42155 RepID=A0A0R3R3E9_9BILA|nr:unnamed protein product [Brugia timori]